MILWLRVEAGPRAEGGRRERRQEAVSAALGLMVGAQTVGKGGRLEAWPLDLCLRWSPQHLEKDQTWALRKPKELVVPGSFQKFSLDPLCLNVFEAPKCIQESGVRGKGPGW